MLEFTTHLPTSSIYSSVTFAHCLLVALPNISQLSLPYNYLLQLINSPLIIQNLTQKIDFLWITCYNDTPLFEDMIRIINIFSKNLRSLYFEFYIDFPYTTFCLILPLLIRRICTKLTTFDIRLWSPQLSTFSQEFRIWFKGYLKKFRETNENQANSMEYKIQDQQFAISFDVLN